MSVDASRGSGPSRDALNNVRRQLILDMRLEPFVCLFVCTLYFAKCILCSTGSQGIDGHSATVSLDHTTGRDLSDAPADLLNVAQNRLNSTSQNDAPPVFSPSEEDESR